MLRKKIQTRRESFRKIKLPSEIIFMVEDAPEGGYTARALNASIYTEAAEIPLEKCAQLLAIAA